jgi:hypothetical protein
MFQNLVTNISDLKNAAVQSPIQAEKVHFGDVIHYGDHPIPRALTKAPFFPETFLGREADLRRIRERLLAPDGHFLLLVNGEGGMGKTTLASKYYHDYQHEYAHTAWLLSEKSIANALLLLADPLGLQFDERMGTEGRLDLLLVAMANLEKPCLLVLDNANELPDLDANYQHLRRLSHVHLLLTTRISNFEKAETLHIDGLPETEALALFEDYYRPLREEERALFFQIREAVGGNPVFDDSKLTVLAGIPIFHSQDKKEVCYIGKDKTADYQKITLVYTGMLKPSRKITGFCKSGKIAVLS